LEIVVAKLLPAGCNFLSTASKRWRKTKHQGWKISWYFQKYGIFFDIFDIYRIFSIFDVDWKLVFK